MIKKITYKRLASILLLVFCFSPTFSFAGENNLETADETKTDTFDIKNESFLLPQSQPSGKYSSAVYLMNIFVPPDWTLDIIKAPMLGYSGKYTLPYNLNIQATLATLVVSTRIDAGLWWNHSINNFHFGAGYHIAFNYGILNQFGFHSELTGWEHQPALAAGYSFNKMALTIRGDVYVTEALYLSEGGYTIPYTNNYVNGFSITTSLEQRLVKNKVMSVGFKWNYLRYHILAWPAFPVNNNRYSVPEVTLGYNF